jgi:hypothetical protein
MIPPRPARRAHARVHAVQQPDRSLFGMAAQRLHRGSRGVRGVGTVAEAVGDDEREAALVARPLPGVAAGGLARTRTLIAPTS